MVTDRPRTGHRKRSRSRRVGKAAKRRAHAVRGANEMPNTVGTTRLRRVFAHPAVSRTVSRLKQKSGPVGARFGNMRAKSASHSRLTHTGRTSSTSGTKWRSRFWMPWRSVAVEEGQPEQAPFMAR